MKTRIYFIIIIVFYIISLRGLLESSNSPQKTNRNDALDSTIVSGTGTRVRLLFSMYSLAPPPPKKCKSFTGFLKTPKRSSLYVADGGDARIEKKG